MEVDIWGGYLTMAWAAPTRATMAYEKRIVAGGVGDCLQ